ncbi:MAG: hypothetical protein PVF17_06550 [Ignavibacteria bacterium]|jgi:hypothetical protein
MLENAGAEQDKRFYYELIERSDLEHLMFAPRKKRDEEDDDQIDDDFNEEDENEDEENPFDIEPSDRDILESDFPLDNPEDDLLDDEEEIPYN